MSRLYGDLVDTLVPERVRKVLLADGYVSGFFGTAIHANAAGQLIGRSLRAPALEIVPITLKQIGRPGDHIEGVYLIHLFAYFPAETPADAALTVLDAPSGVPSGTGPLDGSYNYCVTGFTDTAESYCSAPSAAVEPSTENVTLTVPVAAFSAVGRRIWRQGLGTRIYRYLHTIYDNTTTEWVDTNPSANLSDEIAPDVFLHQRIGGAIKLALENAQTLPSDIGEALTAPVFDVGEDTLTFSPQRNQWVLKIPVMHTIVFSRTTRQSIEESY